MMNLSPLGNLTRQTTKLLTALAMMLSTATLSAGELNWLTNYEQAVKVSKESGKPILADFTGSDWCGWCIRLKDEVFSKDTFSDWAKQNVVLLELDFPRNKKLAPELVAQNRKLQQKYGVRGFPTILFLTPQGEVLGKSGYMEGGPSVWTASAGRMIGDYIAKNANNANAEPLVEDDGEGYPPIIEKQLYAQNDLRGKQAPELHVEQWLTAKPKTDRKVVLVDFWATWCGPCRKAIPELNKYQEKFKDDLVVIGISDETAEKVQAFMGATTINYAMGIDEAGVMSEKVKVQGIPHVLVISSDGIVRWQGFPGSQQDPLTEEVLARIIKADKARLATQARVPR